MATQQRSPTDVYRCPDCSGAVAFEDGAWSCTDCGHVPRHSAD